MVTKQEGKNEIRFSYADNFFTNGMHQELDMTTRLLHGLWRNCVDPQSHVHE